MKVSQKSLDELILSIKKQHTFLTIGDVQTKRKYRNCAQLIDDALIRCSYGLASTCPPFDLGKNKRAVAASIYRVYTPFYYLISSLKKSGNKEYARIAHLLGARDFTSANKLLKNIQGMPTIAKTVKLDEIDSYRKNSIRVPKGIYPKYFIAGNPATKSQTAYNKAEKKIGSISATWILSARSLRDKISKKRLPQVPRWKNPKYSSGSGTSLTKSSDTNVQTEIVANHRFMKLVCPDRIVKLAENASARTLKREIDLMASLVVKSKLKAIK